MDERILETARKIGKGRNIPVEVKKNWQQPLPVQIHDKMGQGKEEEGQGV